MSGSELNTLNVIIAQTHCIGTYLQETKNVELLFLTVGQSTVGQSCAGSSLRSIL